MSDKKNTLRNWTKEECEELVRFFFERREILIDELLKRKIRKDLNDIVGKLSAEDFKPSPDQVKRKMKDILKSDTKETKAEENMSPKVKDMVDQIRKEIEEAKCNADTDGIGSPSLASGGSAPSPVPNIKPALSPTTGGSNRSAPGVLDQAGNQDSPAPGVLNQAEIQEQLDELTELYKTLNLRVKRLEDNEKKPEKKK